MPENPGKRPESRCEDQEPELAATMNENTDLIPEHEQVCACCIQTIVYY